MKQARMYETKIRGLLKAIPKRPAGVPQKRDPVGVMIEAILSANATAARAARAVSILEKEYVDYNELRVSPEKDIVDVLGHDYPQARERAKQLLQALGGVYAAACETSLDYLEGKAKRELRRLLAELGLDEYACACVMMFAFDMHAVPVDRDLADSLEMNALVHPGSTIEDVQKVLERAVGKTRTVAAHNFLRSYVQKCSKALARKRKAQAKARQEAQAREDARRLAAEKEAAARKAAKARKAKEAEKAARAKEAAAKKKKKKEAKKKVVKKKVVKKAAKKTAKKAAGKTVRKTVKKVAKKTAKKKTAKKARTKAAGK